jgi:hypothetical protein
MTSPLRSRAYPTCYPSGQACDPYDLWPGKVDSAHAEEVLVEVWRRATPVRPGEGPRTSWVSLSRTAAVDRGERSAGTMLVSPQGDADAIAISQQQAGGADRPGTGLATVRLG